MALATRQSLTVLAVLSLCCTLVTAVLEVPARNTFLVREKSAGSFLPIAITHSFFPICTNDSDVSIATVIGDYVYVDGGELSQWSVNRVREGR